MERRTFLTGCAAGTLAVALHWPDAADAAVDADELHQRFRAPPAEAKPHTWWHWMNGNVTADGITRDLEAMARVGIGGVQMFDVGCGIPAGPVSTQSAEWVRLVRHAADECERLGLSFTLHNCPGWSSSGGPWITPELSMQQLVWSEALVPGGAVDRTLPQPFTRLGFYRDALVLAVPGAGGDVRRGAVTRATLNGNPVDVRLLIDGEFGAAVEVRPGEQPSELVLDLDGHQQIASVTIRAMPVEDGTNYALTNVVRVEGSDDGTRWRALGEAPLPVWRLRTLPPITVTFAATRVRQLRLHVPGRMSIAEITLSASPRIEDVGDKAGWGRSANLGERPTHSVGGEIDPEQVIDVSRFVDSAGRLRWTAPDGEWTILRFGHTPTGAKNVAAPDAGLGLECDKFSQAALDFHFDNYFGQVLPTLKRLGKRDLAGAIIDSYEAGMQNWTADLPAEFARRRGYPLTRYLPAVTGRIVGSPEVSERFLWDLRRCHATLMEERYFGRFHALCQQHGLVSYTEPYGNGPFDDMAAGVKVDALMGEFWVRGGAAAYSVKVAATTAHVHGKRFVGAESFTGRPAQSRWLEHPYAMKALGDEMYCLGLNHFVFHRYAQQPHPTARPGMTMGPWGFHFDRTNTWFDQAGPWLTYAARCQQMLREGHFCADILYFAGENSPVQVPVAVEEPVAATLSGARPTLPLPVPDGYDYDVCDAEVLMRRVRVEDGAIVLPEGTRYRILVTPSDRRITAALLERIAALVNAGMWLVGPRPEHSHGLSEYPNSDATVRRLADRLWGDLDGRARTSRRVGQGRVFWGTPLEAVLAEAGLPRDAEITSRSGDAVTSWIHRRLGDADLYFVANGRRRREDLVASFRVAGRQPELWDPMTGTTTLLDTFSEEGGRTHVPLSLDEAGSCFVVFRHAARRRGTLRVAPHPAAVADSAAGDFALTAWIKPETDLWPISPVIASSSTAPEVAAARATALARGGSMAMLAKSGASFLLDPPVGSEPQLAVSAGRNGVILYAVGPRAAPAVLTASVPIAGWTHLAVVAAGDQLTIALDGKQVVRGARPQRLGVTRAAAGGRPRLFEGDVAELVLHRAALSDAEVVALARRGVPLPPAPSGRTLTTTGVLSWRPESSAIEGPWEITFPPDLGAPASIRLEHLASLHRHADFGVRHFSGTATWRTRFTASPVNGERLFLDLGRVEVIADVQVNGRSFATLWTPPFRLDVTDALRSGSNELTVRVTNLWPNRLIGDEHFPTPHAYDVTAFNATGGIAALPDWYREGRPQPKSDRVAFTTWRHYDKDDPLLESGLLGPARLFAATLEPFA